MFYFIGITISLFLALLLLGKKHKTSADKILTAWLVLLCLHLVLYYISFSWQNEKLAFLFGLHFPLPLLYGPFLYLYAATLTNEKSVNGIQILLHFLPAMICWLAFIPFYLLSFNEKMTIVKAGGAGYQPVYAIAVICIIVSGIGYVIWTSILLRRHRKRIHDQFSYTEKINLNWLQYLTYGIGLIWVFIIFSHDEIIYAVAVLFILFLGYFGIKQVGIFTQDHNNKEPLLMDKDLAVPVESVETNTLVENTTGKKYSKSGLSMEAADELHTKLVGLMQTEKLFRKGDLDLAQLAQRLQTHPNYLSQVINDKEQKNFFDYINSLRTAEFIAQVSNTANQKYTLLGIAYECGFNSKSSFNRYFKKITGQSPSEYLDALKTANPAGTTLE